MNRQPMPRSSKPMTRSSLPMQRTAMARSAFGRGAGVTGLMWDEPKLPVALRKRPGRPKKTKIRQSAKGEACTLGLPGCCNDAATTVWCHSNRLADGKGMGLKASDEAGCYGCFTCHALLDGGWTSIQGLTFDQVQQYFEIARARSRAILQHKGLIAA